MSAAAESAGVVFPPRTLLVSAAPSCCLLRCGLTVPASSSTTPLRHLSTATASRSTRQHGASSVRILCLCQSCRPADGGTDSPRSFPFLILRHTFSPGLLVDYWKLIPYLSVLVIKVD
ncbi:hypothetical protein SKAU_G00240190 [Synaphobranchus kaupii]|uniref:Uncharacterized protein n=1 Tax=Synaphobranchus kaupii TaxID=118154 RepID=A0A9Q1F7I4_SYNKA|nr:hypothetical protein SKAU_G00240190 [Synaphobranchus kaupii]